MELATATLVETFPIVGNALGNNEIFRAFMSGTTRKCIQKISRVSFHIVGFIAYFQLSFSTRFSNFKKHDQAEKQLLDQTLKLMSYRHQIDIGPIVPCSLACSVSLI